MRRAYALQSCLSRSRCIWQPFENLLALASASAAGANSPGIEPSGSPLCKPVAKRAAHGIGRRIEMQGHFGDGGLPPFRQVLTQSGQRDHECYSLCRKRRQAAALGASSDPQGDDGKAECDRAAD